MGGCTQNLKGGQPRAIPDKFGLIWFSKFRGEELNVIFYQNMPYLNNRYKSTEIHRKSRNILSCLLPCSCRQGTGEGCQVMAKAQMALVR